MFLWFVANYPSKGSVISFPVSSYELVKVAPLAEKSTIWKKMWKIFFSPSHISTTKKYFSVKLLRKILRTLKHHSRTVEASSQVFLDSKFLFFWKWKNTSENPCFFNFQKKIRVDTNELWCCYLRVWFPPWVLAPDKFWAS